MALRTERASDSSAADLLGIQMRVPRSAEDQKESLEDQVELLQMACSAFDAGKRSAAKQIAATLRILLHESGRSKALLQQMGLREARFSEWNYSNHPRIGGRAEKAPVADLTAEITVMVGDGPHAKEATVSIPAGPECRLAVMFADSTESRYVAPLSSVGTEIRKRFAQWWSDEIVRDNVGHVFSRRDLVLNVTNTDGGAHVDPKLDAAYEAFSRRNSMDWKFRPEGEEWRAIPDAADTLENGALGLPGALRVQGSNARAPWLQHRQLQRDARLWSSTL